MAGENTINKNVGGAIHNPSVEKAPSVAPSGSPVVGSGTSTGASTTPDVASDAAALRRMEGPRSFRTPTLLGSVTPAERKLPGGSINAAWDRLAEYGPQANVAATVVAQRHGML